MKSKRFLSALIVFSMIFGSFNVPLFGGKTVSVGIKTVEAADSDGFTVNDTAKTAAITSAAGLKAFAESVNSGTDYSGYTITLSNSIDISGEEWTPIGKGTRSGKGVADGAMPFKGTFNGNKKTISGLTITSASWEADEALGLFGVVDGGTIKDLTLTGVNIDVSASELAGGAVGMMINGAKAQNIKVSGSVSAKRGNGGIVGRMTVSGTISGCVNNAVIRGTGANVGGIVGAAYYTETGKAMYIKGCQNNGTVTGSSSNVGGIVGFSSAHILSCFNYADITGNGCSVAGISAEQQNYGNVKNCVNSGDIKNNGGNFGTGGIVGWIRYSGGSTNYPLTEKIIVSGNYNSGSITSSGTSASAGGIVGHLYNAAEITGNTNNAAAVSGENFAAGIVGSIQISDGSTYYSNPDVKVWNNISTTALDSITGGCKDLYAYNNAAGTFTVESNYNDGVAEVNGSAYPTLFTAIEAAKDGDTIKLLHDYTVETPEIYKGYNLPNGATLDLDGKTLTVPYTRAVFQSSENGTSTITNGTIACDDETNYPLYIGEGDVAIYPTTIVVEDVKVEGGINACMATVVLNNVVADASSKAYYAVWADADAEIIINSGTYTCGKAGWAVRSSAKATSVTIKGGTFNTDVTAVEDAYGSTVSKVNFVAEGYEQVANGDGTYKVQKKGTTALNDNVSYYVTDSTESGSTETVKELTILGAGAIEVTDDNKIDLKDVASVVIEGDITNVAADAFTNASNATVTVLGSNTAIAENALSGFSKVRCFKGSKADTDVTGTDATKKVYIQDKSDYSITVPKAADGQWIQKVELVVNRDGSEIKSPLTNYDLDESGNYVFPNVLYANSYIDTYDRSLYCAVRYYYNHSKDVVTNFDGASPASNDSYASDNNATAVYYVDLDLTGNNKAKFEITESTIGIGDTTKGEA